MKEKNLKEANRIRDELTQIGTVVSHIERDWEKFARTGDEAYLKAVAYDLHGFYSGLERIFESVAATIDDYVPKRESWHKDLLEQMSKDIAGIRPALLSRGTVTLLDEYMRFRHRVRNIYSFNLIPGRIKTLIDNLPTVYRSLSAEILDFVQFLERAA